MKRKKGTFCIALGLLLIAAALALTAYNLWDADRADQAAQAVVVQMRSLIPDEPGHAISDEYPDREMPAIEIDGYRYIGLLEVPALDLTLPVMEEWDYGRLKIAPCRYAGSVYQNNMVIAGHNYARHFSPLKWLPIGSEINFIDVEGQVYHYEIGWLETLQPDQTEDMVAKEETADWDLTLFTCTTGGGSRCTIRCVKKGEEPR